MKYMHQMINRSAQFLQIYMHVYYMHDTLLACFIVKSLILMTVSNKKRKKKEIMTIYMAIFMFWFAHTPTILSLIERGILLKDILPALSFFRFL